MVKPAPYPLYIFRGLQNNVSSVEFSRVNEKDILLTGSSAHGKLSVWDLKTMKIIAEFWVAENVNDNNPIICCGKWKCGFWAHQRNVGLKFWHLENFSTETDFTISNEIVIENNFPGFCGCVKYSTEISDGGIEEIFLLPTNESFQLFTVCDTGYKLFNVLHFDNKTFGMAMCAKYVDTNFESKSDNLRCLIVGFENGEIHLWNLKSFAHVNSVKLFSEAVMALDFKSYGNLSLGLAGSTNSTAAVFDLNFRNNNEIVKKDDRIVTLPSDGISCISIRDDLLIFALAGWDYKIRIFSCKSFKPLAVVDFHTDSVQAIQFDSRINKSEKTGYFCAASNDGCVSLWSFYE